MSDTAPSFVPPPAANSSPRADARLDVVFVHGLGGDRYTTWQVDTSTFWPAWLAEDFPSINFYTAGYDSGLFAKVFTGGGPTIIDRATMMLDMLLSRTVKASAIVFIVHSLGGLIIKQMLRRCNDAGDPSRKALLDSVRGVTFLGTPHQGAQAAVSVNAAVGLFLSKALKGHAFGSEQLDDLNEWFRNWAGNSTIAVRSYYETDKTKGLTIVDRVTANPHVHGCDPVALPSDHIGMCKPKSRDAQIYQSVSAMLREILAGLSGGIASPAGRQAIETYAAFNEDIWSTELQPELLVDYQSLTTRAPDDRQTLEEKLVAAGRAYQVRDGERKKERFHMTLQRHIAQPAALAHYTRMMADIETRFNRHAQRAISMGGTLEEVDRVIQQEVIDPVLESHSSSDTQITATTVDGALYYLTGNCHLRWDDGKD